jgi:hypothetical protein
VFGDVGEEGVMGEVGAESHPRREETGAVGLSGRHDAASGRFRRRHEFRAECIAVESGHMRQGLSCGKVVSNNVSRAASDMCILREMVSAMVLASPLMWETSWK